MSLRTLSFLMLVATLAACAPGDPSTETASEAEKDPMVSTLPPIQATNAFYYYADVDAAWEFYTRVLGFSTVADYGFAKMLRVGPTSFLTLVDEERGMHSSQEPKSATLAIVTEEVEGWWDYLSGAGVEMRASLGSEEGRPHDGFVAIDPEGYLLEFERFNVHPENDALMPVLNGVESLYPDGSETAPGVVSQRPDGLGVHGTVLWLYYEDLELIENFYRQALGVDILVDQDGWAKVYPASETGFIGFVDGERGLHQATEEKAVTVSFFTSELDVWLKHLEGVPGFELRPPGMSGEGDFVRTFVGYDPEGYFLEWDDFLDVQVNQDLLQILGEM